MESIPLYIGIFLFGTLWGSFFYTLALRMIRGEHLSARELLGTRSRCPRCQERIHPLFLVPLAGYLLALGRCRRCKNPISPAYPLAEITGGLAALAAAHFFGMGPAGLAHFLIIAVLVTLSYIDVRTRTLPNSLVILLALVSLYPVLAGGHLVNGLWGALLMGGIFVVILLIFPGSFGGGDVKLALVLGFLLGTELSLVALETAVITGALTGVIWGLASGRGLRSFIPFGPFLALGALVALFYGWEIITLYHSIVS